MVKRIFVLVCLALLSSAATAATITAQVDRDLVRLNESFKIIFEADDDIDASPDFSPLERDFDILSRSRSSQMQILNGDITRQTRWTLFVMARQAGELTIPAIRIGQDLSPAFSVTVKDGDTSGSAAENMDMFLEVEAEPASAYVQAQVLYTVRFYRAIDVNGAKMSEPRFSGGEVLVQPLGDDTSFETQRHGRRYLVIERRYALFPQQSGRITIEPVTLDAQVVVAARGVFDPFGQNTTTRRLTSQRLQLDIKPVPATMQDRPWLPATALNLSESWSQQPPDFVVGEPVTRTLTLKAEGLTAAQLPALTMDMGAGVKVYPDQPRLNDKRGSHGISGTRQEKMALMPTRAGPLTLPAIEIPWWNTATQQLEIARLPARTVQVQAGATATPPPVTPVPAAPAAAPAETVPAGVAGSRPYLWLSVLLGLGWLVTALLWYLSRRRATPRRGLHPAPRPVLKTPLHTVRKACLGNDPQQAQAALLRWARGHWPEDPPASLDEIGRRLGAATQTALMDLNQALYGAGANDWEGETLWRALERALREKAQQGGARLEPLLPLYP